MSEAEAAISGASEPNVTFVGGRAVEQSEGLDSNVDPETRTDALAAVREAIQKAGEDAAEGARSSKAKDPYRPAGEALEGTPERGPDGKFLPREGTKEPAKTEESSEEPLDLDKASVKQILKAREKVAAAKREAKVATDEVSKVRAQLAQESQQLQSAWAQIQETQRHIQAEKARYESLRKDPAKAVRDLGWDPEQFILDLAQEGTPEGQAKRQHQALMAQIEELKQWKSSQAQQVEQQKAQYQQHQMVQARQNAVGEFLNKGMNEEKYPHVATFYKGKEKFLVAQGDIAAEEYRNLSGGKEASYEDLLDYLEDELASSTTAVYTKRGTKTGSSQRSDIASKSTNKNSQSSKGKSLNPDVSGERRTLAPKDLRDLDADERLEAAKQSVRVALAASSRNDD